MRTCPKSLRFDSFDRAFHLRYRQSTLKDSPHVVKLSGGRSSAFMLALLLKNDLLCKDRGDVVVFNNTSAEHPETYKFVAKLKQYTESYYSIPFFLTEFATYEDISSGNYARFSTFRLVNEKPKSDENPDGYHYKGEVFEELLSYKAFLPNRHRRVCTSTMKIHVTEQFLSSWFACKDELEHLGHYGKTSRMTDEGICGLHAKNGGKTPNDILLKKREFVRNRPVARPEQSLQNFTSVKLDDRSIDSMAHACFGGVVDLRSREFPVAFTSLVGLRADETERLKKLNARICGAEDSENGKPSSERVYTPLADNALTKEDVLHFWSQQDWDLNLDANKNLSNCAFCFLKSSNILKSLAIDLKSYASSNEFSMTPMDVRWWESMEEKYSRDLVKENRVKINKDADVSLIGFFEENMNFCYKDLRQFSENNHDLDISIDDDSKILACNCTD